MTDLRTRGPERPRVGFLSPHDPRDPDAQSGAPYHAARTIAADVGELLAYGPARPLIRHPLKLVRRISMRAAPRRAFHESYSILAARAAGRILTRRIRATPVDWIFAAYASTDAAFVRSDVPIVYYSDTTFRALIDYYPGFMNLSPHTKRAGDRLEGLSIRKSALCLFSSEWAARSAIRDYGADPARVAVNELGANVDAPAVTELRLDAPAAKLRLLFVGVDWIRKGGPIASATTRVLREQGIEAELTVVGCEVPVRDRHAGVVEVGWLSRTEPRARAHLRQLMLDSHLLLVPSRAECFGLVYPEAAAHALPSIATDTGGVSSAVVEGRSGHLLSIDAAATEYADLVARLVSDGDRYRQLRQLSRATYEERFTWAAWGKRLAALTRQFGPSAVSP